MRSDCLRHISNRSQRLRDVMSTRTNHAADLGTIALDFQEVVRELCELDAVFADVEDVGHDVDAVDA